MAGRTFGAIELPVTTLAASVKTMLLSSVKEIFQDLCPEAEQFGIILKEYS